MKINTEVLNKILEKLHFIKHLKDQMLCCIGLILQRKKGFYIYKISHELNQKLKSHGCLDRSRKFPLTKFYIPLQ